MNPQLVPRLFDRRADSAPRDRTLDGLVEVDRDHVLTEFRSPRARAALAAADVLLTGWGCPRLDEDALAAAPRLRAVVHTAGTVRHLVTAAVWERGIVVSTAAAANAVPVAEYALAMILLAGKRVPGITREFRENRVRADWRWRYPAAGNYRTTVGLLSASLVGRRVAELLRPFDLHVLLHDPYVSADDVEAMGAEPVALEELFRRSAVLSLHAPLLPETTGLVDGRLLALLPDGATLVNTARGAVVDAPALEAELLSGRLNAVLDVTSPEPLPPSSPLWDRDNVVLTPHIAGSDFGELQRLADSALDELARWCAGEPFRHPVHPHQLARTA